MRKTKAVVISSLTRQPMELKKQHQVIPNKAKEDEAYFGEESETNTERLLREVPPHWEPRK